MTRKLVKLKWIKPAKDRNGDQREKKSSVFHSFWFQPNTFGRKVFAVKIFLDEIMDHVNLLLLR